MDHPRDHSKEPACRRCEPHGVRPTPAHRNCEHHGMQSPHCGYPATTKPLYRSCLTPVICSIHPLNQNTSQCGEICASIIMQSKNLNIIESHTKRFPQRVSKHQQEVDFNPSPATAKGHMKRPRHGIRSTTPKANMRQSSIRVPDITFPVPPAAIIRSGSTQRSE